MVFHHGDHLISPPSLFASLLLLGAALLATGCQLFSHSAAESKNDPLTLHVKFDKAIYQPGEVVKAQVTLANHTSRPQRVRVLDPKSVLFFFGRLGDPERMERSAVTSKDEPLDQTQELAPGASCERIFILTRLSEFSGPLAAQAHYQLGTTASSDVPTRTYSNVVHFEVKGERLFQRDPAGYITEQEAVRLATAAAGRPVRSSEAILITDEKGFDKWWVNLTCATGQPERVAYFVNPYLGRVSYKAEPFNPQLAQDARFKRPAGLPSMPVQGNVLAPPSAAGK